jgi:polyhydroxybutyrate depolymerase
VVRTYELRVPDSYAQGQPAPVLLAFHGNPDTGAGFESRSGLTTEAMDAGFITVYPNGIQGTWGIEDVILVHDLILHLADNLSVDTDRVYATGFSAGGTMTHLIACALPDEIAAVAVVGATIEKDVVDICPSDRLIPLMFIHGTEDAVFPWHGGVFRNAIRFSVAATLDTWKFLNRCRGEPVVDTLPDLIDDGTLVWSESWSDCGGNAEILFYGVENGGHTWPSGPGPFPPGLVTREISNEEIVEFLARHSLAGAR